MLKDLYYATAVNQYYYSNTPSNDIDLSRMINGLPPFRHLKPVHTNFEKKHVLFQSDSDRSAAFKYEDRLREENCLTLLTDLKFSVDSINNTSGDEISIADKTAKQAEYAKSKGIPYDQILYISRNESYSFFEAMEKPDALGPEVFSLIAPYTKKKLLPFFQKNSRKFTLLYIRPPFDIAELAGQEIYQHLSNVHKLNLRNLNISPILDGLLNATQKLEQLLLTNCEIGDLQLSTNSLPLLKKIDLDLGSIEITALQMLLLAAPNVEEIKLALFTNGDKEINFDLASQLSLPALKELILIGSTVNNVLLQAILKATPKLEKLELRQRENLIDDIQLEPNSLASLQHLNIAKIEPLSLRNIFCAAPNLHEVILTRFKNPNGHLGLAVNSLASTKNIMLVDCRCSGEFFGDLLQATPNLEELSLQSTTLAGNFHPLPNSLPHLKYIILNLTDNSVMEPSSLQALLLAAPNAVAIILYQSQALNEKFWLPPGSLPSLKGINVSKSALNKTSLEALLRAAPNLEIINLSDCTNLDKEETIALIKENFKHIRDVSFNINKPYFYPPFDSESTSDSTPASVAEQLFNIEMDADTTPAEITYHTKRSFIGYPYTPHSSALRIQAFKDFVPNPKFNGQKNPFLLVQASSSFLVADDGIIQSKNSLLAEFEQKKSDTENSHYLGRFELSIGNQWRPLPSVCAQETLLQFYTDSEESFEIAKNNADGLYYIRAKDVSAPAMVKLEVLLQAPQRLPETQALPGGVRELIKFCRGFRQHTLKNTEVFNTPEDYLKALYTQRLGACRHRAIVFKHLMQEQFPHIPTQIISNDSHMYAEVLYQGDRVRCDLGGYAADEEIDDEANFSDVTLNIQEPELRSQELARMNIGVHGQERTNDFFSETTNLTTLTVKQNLHQIPATLNIAQLDTLNLVDCSFTAEELALLLSLTPNLRTLTISYPAISRDVFQAIDLSVLPKLEWVELKGEFVPDADSLVALITKHPTYKNIRWIVNDVLFDASELPESIVPFVELKPSQRQLPKDRYTTRQHLQMDLQSALQQKKPTLMLTANPTDMAYFIQQHCLHTSRPVFFVDDAQQLKCQRPAIVSDGDHGIIQEGPAGPLYDFLQKNPTGVIVIDYSRFSAGEIAQFNTICDTDNPKVDGIALQAKIIGVINPDDPLSYQGDDFYPRFQQVTLDAPALPALTERIVDTVNPNDSAIELAGIMNAVDYLQGHWTFLEGQLKFKEGALSKALQNNTSPIVLRNPPLEDPEFVRFVHDWDLQHPHGPALYFYSGLALTAISQCLQWSEEATLPAHFTVLNSDTLNKVLGNYTVDKTNQLIFEPGFIATSAAPALYVTETLSLKEWIMLMRCANQHQKQLTIHLAPGVQLPIQLPQPESTITKQLDLPEHTQLFINLAADIPTGALVLDVSDFGPHDLFPSARVNFNNKTLAFDFKYMSGYLTTALDEGATIVLKGTWSIALRQSMQAFIAQRALDANARGQLILVAESEEDFACVNPKAINPPRPPAVNPLQPVTFEERYNAVVNGLKTAPFAFLAGETGVGKTYFMQNTWGKRHPCFFGEDATLAWLNEKPKNEHEFITLFIDEANITNRCKRLPKSA